MLPTIIKSRPSQDDDFTQLHEYQQATPDKFFHEEGHKPVLYFHDEHIKAWCSPEHAAKLHIFVQDKRPSPPESLALENDGGQHLREEEQIEVFVASHKLVMYSRASEIGIEIPYPSITLHAVKTFRQNNSDDPAARFTGVYMQLQFSGEGGDDDDDSSDPIELTLVPHSPDNIATHLINPPRTSALFDHISQCQNLHPDPADDDEDDDDDAGDEMDRIVFEGEALDGLPGAFQGETNGGLPAPMPGSSGWITAENVNEYFDEQGNWIGVGGELGEGAGRVRGHDEVDGNTDGTNGHDAGDDDAESKRPRTE